jgi:hypothetical protein
MSEDGWTPESAECTCQSIEEHHRRNAGWQGRVRQNPEAVAWDLATHRLLDQDGRDVENHGDERPAPVPSRRRDRLPNDHDREGAKMDDDDWMNDEFWIRKRHEHEAQEQTEEGEGRGSTREHQVRGAVGADGGGSDRRGHAARPAAQRLDIRAVTRLLLRRAS